MDDSNRESFVIDIDTSLPTKRIIRVLGWLVELRGNSESIRLKSGPEFISEKLKVWCEVRDIRLLFIQPENRYRMLLSIEKMYQ